MTTNTKGWVVFLAALGVLFTLTAQDLGNVTTWSEVFLPGFISKLLAHLGTVIAAFVGGRLIGGNGHNSFRKFTGQVKEE